MNTFALIQFCFRMLPVYLNCPFLIAPSVFSNIYHFMTYIRIFIFIVECLREKYKKASNYKLILDEMVSSIMQRTVDKFDDGQIPYHIKNILTPACGRPRRVRAHLFMQYVLLNDDVLRSFENVLSATDFVDLDNVTCSDCTPGTSRGTCFHPFVLYAI